MSLFSISVIHIISSGHKDPTIALFERAFIKTKGMSLRPGTQVDQRGLSAFLNLLLPWVGPFCDSVKDDKQFCFKIAQSSGPSIQAAVKNLDMIRTCGNPMTSPPSPQSA
jgi:hypothetical protein